MSTFDPQEDLSVTVHHDVYPGIDPVKFAHASKGKVVFITGASRGIGEAAARAFAESGASVFLAARSGDALEGVKKSIEETVPGARVGWRITDVVEAEQVKSAVETCVKQFGRIDVVVSNSGLAETLGPKLAELDPKEWWYTWEVNVKGCSNTAHYTLPYLVKSKGSLIFMGSTMGQTRLPGVSGYQAGKHALNRIGELIAVEHADDDVKVFIVHPGAVLTKNAGGRGYDTMLIDDPKLSAWTMVRLATGSEDYLSGRFLSANWDLDEVRNKYKEAIVKQDALKNRLVIPVISTPTLVVQ